MFSASEYLLSLKPDAHRIEALCEALRMLKSAVDPGPRLMWLAGLGVDEHSVWRDAAHVVNESGRPEAADAPAGRCAISLR